MWRDSGDSGGKHLGSVSFGQSPNPKALTPDDTVPGIQNCFLFPLILLSPWHRAKRSEIALKSGGGSVGREKQLTRRLPHIRLPGLKQA